MRTFLFFAGSMVGSIAFQLSVAIYPQQLQNYAWAVKYVWLTWLIVWIAWLISHPSLLGASWNKPAPSKPTAPLARAEATGGNATATGGSVVQYFNSPHAA